MFNKFRSFASAIALTSAALLGASLLPAQAGEVPLVPTKGTTSFVQGVTWQGVGRSVVFIKPNKKTSGKAPAIVLLHYNGGTPNLMANIAQAGKWAAKMGYWVIVPPAIDGQWNDSPADRNNPTDDVGFLTQVIQTAVAQYPIDATRVSMAGLSNGGFMTERMACERPELIASGVAVAAVMRTALYNECAPGRAVPMTYVMGTADPIVAYDGQPTMKSAPTSFSFWDGVNRCNDAMNSNSTLKTKVKDGTSVTLQHNAACSSRGEVNLYTVNGGGHAWPGAKNVGGSWPSAYGVVSQNLDTTTMIGNFAKLWTTGSTH